MFNMELIVILITILLLLIWKTYNRKMQTKYSFWERRNVPYLKPRSYIFGNFGDYVFGNKTSPQIFEMCYEKLAPHPFGGIFSASNPVLIVRDPELIGKILITQCKHFDQHPHRADRKNPITQTLFNLTGVEWQAMRNKLNPAFISAKIKRTFESFQFHCNILIEEINTRMAEHKCVDIVDIAERYCIDIMTNFIFGVESNSLRGKDSFFHQIGINQARPKPITSILIEFNPSLAKKFGFKFIGDDVRQFFIDTTRELSSQNIQINKTCFLKFLQTVKDDMKLHSNDENTFGQLFPNFEVELMAAQCFIMFMAGFRPTSFLINTVLVELTKNPDVVQKIRYEIDQVFNGNYCEPTEQHLTQMVYLDQVISETIRLYPISPNLERTCIEDIYLAEYGLTIEKGMRVAIPLSGLNLDSKYFDKPLNFNPDNFSKAMKETRPRNVTIPFGVGRRHCIAYRLALWMTKLAIVKIVNSYTLSFSPDFPPRYDLLRFTNTSKFAHPIYVSFKSRH